MVGSKVSGSSSKVNLPAVAFMQRVPTMSCVCGGNLGQCAIWICLACTTL